MGIFYDGPYAEDVNHDAFHEGYAARLWPDGSLTATWGGEAGETGHLGLVGACGCGWRSDRIRPPGPDDSPEYEAALRDFQTRHLDPLVDAARQRSWPRWAASVSGHATQIAALVAGGRLDDADDLLRVLAGEVDGRTAVLAELRAEQEYRTARAGDDAGLVVYPFTDTPRPPTWTRPAPPPPAAPPPSGRSR